MKNAPALHRIEYGLFSALRGLLSVLPLEAARGVGRALGDVAWLALGARRRVTLENLELAMPELDDLERRRIAVESFRHLGRMTCDTIASYRLDAVELCERLTLEGWEHLEGALSRQRGVLVMSAHIGSWEIAAHPTGLYGEPMSVIGRPLDNPLLDRLLMAQRTRFGNSTIAKRGAARGSLRVLRQGGIVGILIDQRVKPAEGTPVPFFGQPAVTSPILGLLAIKTGAPIVPLFGYLEPHGRYRVVFHPPIELGADDTAEDVTARSLAVVERQIRRHPEQWLWLHRRWKR